MNALPDFSTFFRGLWGDEIDPFPWQTMLAERIADGRWPQALDLPTAAGKTACIDAAIYALATQADRPVADRTAPRRIWFVVDRRIVVDEAHARATAIARHLAEASHGPLRATADRLRQVGGTSSPLAVGRLRGGILRDDGWARLPSQPAVITTTVDQLGSRLLFRGYGPSNLAAPIFAGLAANDSLILLDEAHCSVPFMQTLRRIESYRGEAWAECPIKAPFAFAILSATPPLDIPDEDVFPGGERERALDHPVLRKRLAAAKPAELVVVKGKLTQETDPLVAEATKRALAFVREEHKRRVAVIVNRVRTAENIANTLRSKLNDCASVVILTGRMRPFERDRLVEQWKSFLRASSPNEPDKPVILVATQCIEVGADFSFDALVTEAASLDSLRQRFGRLNRMGLPGAAPAVIVIREKDADEAEPDPIYGEAIGRTWRLLSGHENGENAKEALSPMDFGVQALDGTLAGIEDLSPYLAPRPDAPILLPAHLDLLCQTAPVPHPDPDITLFLHGKERGTPEARVVWRADLPQQQTKRWEEIVALCPPKSGEMLSVSLFRLRSWLEAPDVADDDGDVEGTTSAADRAGSTRPILLWRGRDRSKICCEAGDIRPNDIVVIPAAYGIAGLGQSAASEALGQGGLDLWEPVWKTIGKPAAVRLHRSVLQPWLGSPALEGLLQVAEDPAWERESIQEAVDGVLGEASVPSEPPGAPAWWLDLLGEARGGRIANHPGGGVILFAREGSSRTHEGETDSFADEDDWTSVGGCEVSLERHTASVKRAVQILAERCLPASLAEALVVAAQWHDTGKLDGRFQILLRHGDELAAASGGPLAKSATMPDSPARRRAIRAASGLPAEFRHEMLSAQLAGRYLSLVTPELTDITLHLIASHHGHARPFAPVSVDSEPPPVAGHIGDTAVALTGDERSGLPAPHSLDSGSAERFWRLVRRYGWWGLAYLEAILRLGDWYGSQRVLDDDTGEGKAP